MFCPQKVQDISILNQNIMYSVLEFYDNCAEVLDWRYSSIEQSISTSQTDVFQYIGKNKQWNTE